MRFLLSLPYLTAFLGLVSSPVLAQAQLWTISETRHASASVEESPMGSDSEPDGPAYQPVELLITTPDGDRLIFNDPVTYGLNAGDQDRILILRNTSGDTLTNLSIMSNAGTIVEDRVLSISSLAPGAEVEFEVSSNDIVPSSNPSSGNRSVSYGISGVEPAPFELRFRVDYPIDPYFYPSVFGWVTPTRLVLAGQTASFSTQTDSHYPVVQSNWRKGSRHVGSQSRLRLTSVQLKDAGLYTQQIKHKNLVGGGQSTATSSKILFGVVQPAPLAAEWYEGKPLILTCTAAGPKGYNLGYQWYRNDVALQDADGVLGAESGRLQIPAGHALGTGTFECVVTLTGPDHSVSLSHGKTVVRFLSRPVFTPQESFGYSHFAGEVLSYQVHTSDASSLRVKGLPKGLTMNATGLITGVLTKVGLYKFTVIASNGGGTATQGYEGYVKPMLWVGNYHGLADRAPAVEDGLPGLGSYLKVTATGNGRLSGQLTHEGRQWRFAGIPSLLEVIEEEFEWDGVFYPRIHARSSIIIKRGKQLPPLTLQLSPGEMPWFAVTDPETGVTTTGSLRQPASTSTQPYQEYGSRYVITLTSGHGGPSVPGHLIASISKAGRVTWSGRLADGTSVTGSDFLSTADPNSVDEQPLTLPMHASLYQGAGSLHGWAELTYVEDEEIYAPLFTHTLTWNKAPRPDDRQDRLFNSGIPLHDVTLKGTNYLPPARGQLLFDALESEDGAQNLTFTVTGPNIPGGSLSQGFILTSGNKARLPPFSVASPLKSLTFDLKNGRFSGRLLFLHPIDPKLNRSIEIAGILPDLISTQATGFTLLPDLPQADGETLKNTSIQPAKVELRAAE